jgi:hypothetical protein
MEINSPTLDAALAATREPITDYREFVMAAAIQDSDNLRKLSNQIHTDRQAADNIQSALDARRAAIYSDVCQKTKDGKPLFSNDAGRNAETDRIFEQDAISKEMRDTLQAARRDLTAKQYDAEHLDREIRIRRAFLNARVTKLRKRLTVIVEQSEMAGTEVERISVARAVPREYERFRLDVLAELSEIRRRVFQLRKMLDNQFGE